jgi:hypothetical protein
LPAGPYRSRQRPLLPGVSAVTSSRPHLAQQRAGRRIGPRWRATRAPIRRPGWPGSTRSPPPACHKTLSSRHQRDKLRGLGQSPSTPPHVAPVSRTPSNPLPSAALTYPLVLPAPVPVAWDTTICLHSQVSYPTPPDAPTGLITQPRTQSEEAAGKHRENCRGENRGPLQKNTFTRGKSVVGHLKT